MAVTAEQVRAALQAEEPDYARAATELGSGALRHLSAIVGSADALMASKAAYLAGMIGGPASGDVVAKAARSAEAPVRIAAAAAARKLGAAGPARAAGARRGAGAVADGDSILLQLVDDADPGVRKVALRSVPSTMSDALGSRVAALRGEGPAGRPEPGARTGPKRARKAPKKKAAGTARKRKAGATAARARKSR